MNTSGQKLHRKKVFSCFIIVQSKILVGFFRKLIICLNYKRFFLVSIDIGRHLWMSTDSVTALKFIVLQVNIFELGIGILLDMCAATWEPNSKGFNLSIYAFEYTIGSYFRWGIVLSKIHLMSLLSVQSIYDNIK